VSGELWLSEEQVKRLWPHFQKARDKPRLDDRRVMSGIIVVHRNGLRWRHAPAEHGSPETRLTPTGGASRGWACSPA
jgi:transposase